MVWLGTYKRTSSSNWEPILTGLLTINAFDNYQALISHPERAFHMTNHVSPHFTINSLPVCPICVCPTWTERGCSFLGLCFMKAHTERSCPKVVKGFLSFHITSLTQRLFAALPDLRLGMVFAFPVLLFSPGTAGASLSSCSSLSSFLLASSTAAAGLESGSSLLAVGSSAGLF